VTERPERIITTLAKTALETSGIEAQVYLERRTNVWRVLVLDCKRTGGMIVWFTAL
jgi:hypothetical protein